MSDQTVYVDLQGGLGNQLFQYSVGYALARRRGANLKLDASRYSNPYNDRKFELRSDLLPIVLTPAQERKKFWPLDTRYEKFVKRNRQFEEPLKAIFAKNAVPVYIERGIEFDPRVLTLEAPVCLTGYFLSARYFQDYAEEIRAGFFPESARAARKAKGPVRIAVHVRLTDYISERFIKTFTGSCDASYYRKAISQMRKLFPKAAFLVFSDDMDGARQLLSNIENVTFHDQPSVTSWDDLLQMANCDHNIIANSTYSWWAAWLNPNPDKIVVAPRHWFSRAHTRKHDCADIVPPSWLTLESDNYCDPR